MYSSQYAKFNVFYELKNVDVHNSEVFFKVINVYTSVYSNKFLRIILRESKVTSIKMRSLVECLSSKYEVLGLVLVKYTNK